ncbi:MAG: DUF2344 domain-containing protein [Oscillospiraceae bacterium]|nr:DUF2344 domain-containing protein [Oscillospiraceae bacterium]
MAKMHQHRIRYEKTGRGIYISHLDTMAMFQRAFLRAGIDIWQTEGFNRHTYVSIALPLSLGCSSLCEVLEFDLESEIALDQVPEKLNAVLPEGIRVLECYESVSQFKLLRTLDWTITMEYDNGIPAALDESFRAMLAQESYVVRKKSNKSKKGFTEVDIIPMVFSWEMKPEGETTVNLSCNLAAQNPSLNPQVLMDAFTQFAPACKPDFIRYCRKEIYLENGEKFR